MIQFKNFTCLALVLTAGLVAKSPDQKITFSSSGAKASELLPQLGKSAGLQLNASPDVASDFLVVRFDDVTREEALTNIGRAVHATWRHEGVGLVLERTAHDKNALKALDAAYQTQLIRAGQTDMAATLAKQGEFDAATAQQVGAKYAPPADPSDGRAQMRRFIGPAARKLGEKTPVGRALMRLATGIPAEELAELQPGIRYEWSNRPNSLQKSLGELGNQVLAQLVSEQGVWVSSGAAKAAHVDGEFHFSGNMRGAQNYDGTIDTSTTRLLFSTFRETPRGGVDVALDVHGPRGASLMQAGNIVFPDDKDQPADRFQNDTPIEYPDAAKRFARYLVYNGRGQSLPQDVMEAILSPDRNEPLAMVTGPILLATAKAKHCNAVLDVPDETFGYFCGLTAETSPGINQILSELRESMDVEEKGGWLLGWSQLPVFDAEKHADREILGKYLKAKHDSSNLSLDQRCSFALALPSMNDNSLPSVLASRFGDPMPDLLDQDGLMKFYATLSKHDRELAMGDGLPLADLGRKSRIYFNQLLFGRSSMLTGPMEEHLIGGDAHRVYRAAAQYDPAEILPNGIPANAYLKISASEAEGVVYDSASRPLSTAMPMVLNAEQLASQIQTPSVSHMTINGVSSIKTMDGHGLRYVKTHTLDFVFFFTDSITLGQKQLKGYDFAGDTVGDYTGLPPSMRDTVEKLLLKSHG